MAQRLFNVLFPTDEHHVQGLHSELRAALPQYGRVLDLGCGVNTDLAAYRSAECEVWGTDLQVHPELQHREWFRLMSDPATIPFPDGYFDAVACVMVLEHVADPDAFIREVARVLRPGGRFIGHTISGSHYVTWIRRLIGLLPHSLNQALVQKLYGRASVDTFPAFYRLNRLHQIQRTCRSNGLTLLRMQRYADPGYFNFSTILKALAILTDWSCEKVGAGWGRLYFTVTLAKDAASPAQVPTITTSIA